MANPVTTSRNKYHSNIKNSTIYTPAGVCDFLYDIVSPNISRGKIIDPSIGSGNLTRRFHEDGWEIIGYDIDDQCDFININKMNFLKEEDKRDDVCLVICNPPFNTDKRNKDYLNKNKLGKALLPELFADKVFSLYGNDTKLVLLCPMGLRLNQRIYSSNRKISDRRGKRYRKVRDNWPKISSIVSLPLDIFPNVEFHNEILIFNVPELDSHYCLPEEYFY